ncbi:MAG: hypothetical protein LBD41_01745 [Clostridiales Family XIII bacterium]|jgi:hypothetical protein|nr:hypothetical protein [Clostridiales Family XIII bacterium]
MYWDPSEEYEEKYYVQAPTNYRCKKIQDDTWKIISPEDHIEFISDELFRERFECSLKENKKFVLIPGEIEESLRKIINYFADILKNIGFQ